MKCDHQHLKRLDVVVIAGIVNRKMIVCKDCGEVIESEDYDVD